MIDIDILNKVSAELRKVTQPKHVTAIELPSALYDIVSDKIVGINIKIVPQYMSDDVILLHYSDNSIESMKVEYTK